MKGPFHARGAGSAVTRAALVVAMLVCATAASHAGSFRGERGEHSRGNGGGMRYRPAGGRQGGWSERGREGGYRGGDNAPYGGGSRYGGGGAAYGGGERRYKGGGGYGGGGGPVYGGGASRGGWYSGGHGGVSYGHHSYGGGSYYGSAPYCGSPSYSSGPVYYGGPSYYSGPSYHRAPAYCGPAPYAYVVPRTYVSFGLRVGAPYAAPPSHPDIVVPPPVDRQDEGQIDVENEPPAGTYYYDQYCGQRVVDLDTYTAHLKDAGHEGSVDIIVEESGERLRTLEFVDGYWEVQK